MTLGLLGHEVVGRTTLGSSGVAIHSDDYIGMNSLTRN